MKIARINSCNNCPYASYIETGYYSNAYYRCDKTQRHISDSYYNGTIHESCPLEDEPNEAQEPVKSACDHPSNKRSYIGQNILRCNLCGKEFS